MYANLRLIYFEKVRKIPYVVFLLIRYIAATTVLFYLTYISEILPEYVVIILDSISFVEMLALAAIWLQVITYGRRIYINIP